MNGLSYYGMWITLWEGVKSKFKALGDSIWLDVEFTGIESRGMWPERDGARKTKRIRVKKEAGKRPKKGKQKKKSVIPCREHRTFISMWHCGPHGIISCPNSAGLIAGNKLLAYTTLYLSRVTRLCLSGTPSHYQVEVALGVASIQYESIVDVKSNLYCGMTWFLRHSIDEVWSFLTVLRYNL